MPGKSTQLQIRISPRDKAALSRRAKAAGMDVSSFVLACVLPASRRELEQVLRPTDAGTAKHRLAALHAALVRWNRAELDAAIGLPIEMPGEAWEANYIAALIEQACVRHAVPLPAWVQGVAPLEQPWFASQLGSLRLHLLTQSPAAFRRRNLFVDTSLGGQC